MEHASAGAAMTRVDAMPADAGAVAEIKAYLRITHDDEDAVLARLAAVALAHGEGFAGQLLVARGVRETLPAATDWRRLAATPVAAITAVSGLSPMGVAVPLGAADYAVDIDADGDGWVRMTGATSATRLVVTYTAGLAAGWSALPEPIRQGAVRLAAHLFTNRDSAEEGPPPAAVAALWRPWRRMRIA